MYIFEVHFMIIAVQMLSREPELQDLKYGGLGALYEDRDETFGFIK